MTEPRLEPIRSEDVDDEKTGKLLGWLERHDKDVLMAHLFAVAPNVFPSYLSMSDALLNRGVLPSRLRELAILRLARHLDAEYEWWEHHRMSQPEGVTLAELDALESGTDDAASFGEAERLVLRVTDEWHASQWRLDDDLWADAERALGRAQLIELVFVLAWWGAWVPSLVRTFQIEVPHGAGTEES